MKKILLLFLVFNSLNILSQATLVSDFNKGNNSSSPSNKITLKNATYFIADDGIHGIELWKSDGTEVGTIIVKDVYVTSGEFAKKGEELFFSGNDNGGAGNELWKTDGTEAGTVLVKDIRTSGDSYPKSFGVANGLLFFTANDGSQGDDLWKSDGTEAGTVKLKDFTSNSSTSKLNGIVKVFNNEIYFRVGNFDIWKSDGTEASIIKVTSTTPLPYLSTDIINNKLIVFAYENFFLISDGTAAGTEKINTPGVKYSNTIAIDSYQNVGDKIFFQGGAKGELWSTDGTKDGTKPIKVVKPIYTNEQGATKMVNLNGDILFSIEDQFGIGTELWLSDGTEVGTKLVKDINKTGNKSSNPSNLFSFNNEVFFTTNDGVNGLELWKTDANNTNTELVKNIYDGGFSGNPTSFVTYNGNFYFSATSEEFGRELWKSDGTSAGTAMVKDIKVGNGDGLYEISNMVVAQNKLFFLADDGSTALEIWSSDGTEAGTQLVKNISGNFFSYVYLIAPELIVYKDEVYFTSGNLEVGQELWKSDGTEAGTVLVKDIHENSSSVPKEFFVFNDLLFFRANDGTHGEELWKTDGTTAGTTLVKDIREGTGSSGVISYAISNNELFFMANDGVTGKELWKTDGTEEGTKIVKDIDVGSSNSTPSHLIDHKGTLFFFAEVAYGSGRGELWKSDGTEAGTVLVKNIFPSGFGSKNLIVSAGDHLVFSGNTTFKDIEVWKSDGTEAGTVAITDINENLAIDNGSSHPKGFFIHNSEIYFSADNGLIGRELYKIEESALSVKKEIINDIVGVSIYPNPTRNTLHLKVDNQQIKEVKIYNLLGKQVFQSSAKTSEIEKVNISQLSSGMYMIQIKTNQNTFIKKVLKQ
jgi:ELWxxDGT repeat protein